MKKTTKKNPSKAKKAVKDLAVRVNKSGTVRGGISRAQGSSPVKY